MFLISSVKQVYVIESTISSVYECTSSVKSVQAILSNNKSLCLSVSRTAADRINKLCKSMYNQQPKWLRSNHSSNIMSMEKRGEGKIILLRECGHEISNHLRRCHLSRENVTEIDLILARAGLFDLSASTVKQMTVCPKHRNNLGRYWQSPKTCQYPKHAGKFK